MRRVFSRGTIEMPPRLPEPIMHREGLVVVRGGFRKGAALGISQNHFFSDERWGLIGEQFCKVRFGGWLVRGWGQKTAPSCRQKRRWGAKNPAGRERKSIPIARVAHVGDERICG